MPAIAAPAPTIAAVGCAPTPPLDLLDDTPPEALVAILFALSETLDATLFALVTAPPSADVLDATSALLDASALCSDALFEATKPEFEARKAEAEERAPGFEARKAEAEERAAGSLVRLERVERAPAMLALLGRVMPFWEAKAETCVRFVFVSFLG